MRRASALCLLALALAAVADLAAHASADGTDAATRRLLVNGDSLAVGTRPYIPRELARWEVRQSTAISRQAGDGAAIMRAYGRSLPRVIHVSLGTNGDPAQVSAFRAAIRAVMDAAGPNRCVVWTNIVRPPYGGVSYRGYNRALAAESRLRENLRVVNWSRMARQNPGWFGSDGVHPSAEGYRARAEAVARSVRRCV
jgi:lysophospholipase L1-like esterase